jgi:hypothetical protein
MDPALAEANKPSLIRTFFTTTKIASEFCANSLEEITPSFDTRESAARFLC